MKVESLKDFESKLVRDRQKLVSMDLIGDLELGGFILKDCHQVLTTGFGIDKVFMSCSLSYRGVAIGDFVFSQLYGETFSEKNVVSILDGLVMDLFMRSFPTHKTIIQDGVRAVDRQAQLNLKLQQGIETVKKRARL